MKKVEVAQIGRNNLFGESGMIIRNNELFILNTKDTSYCFRVLNSGHLEHLYYGARVNLSGGYDPLIEKKTMLGGNQIAYSKNYPSLGLEDICLEVSTIGKGDIREPFILLTHEDGSSSSDFLFRDARILPKKSSLETLPSSYMEEELSKEHSPSMDGSLDEGQGKNGISLEIDLYDSHYDIALMLTYSVFYDSNIITRSSKVINVSNKTVGLDRIMSGQLDLDTCDYRIHSFHGAWAREMNRYDLPSVPGTYVINSKAGISSNRSNPFFMLSDHEATEDHGSCYAFNLIYSGNHYEAVEVNSMGKTRVLSGIQPMGFGYQLQAGASFEAPECVMTYSNKGFTGISQQMHHFVRNHIVRGYWKKKVRPILLNSWEANYFQFNESKLMKQAKVAAQAGIELFVLDDGWFGERNDDTSSLGDWQENKKKLKNGLQGLAFKVNQLGMEFGIWVEPEMMSQESDLYRKHPDWAVRIPDRDHAQGRNQMILDLTRQDVCSYLIQEMTRVFSSANISYVKWDMNRIFSDHYSQSLAAEQQKEFNHRYILGLYRILDTLTKRFPKILFESCASGGNRFDLGMLCYMPQIWASDNTDAMSRAKIQIGYSYGYPMSVVGAHVSGCPNHQTLRNTSIDTRFEVAAFGLLGYECNLSELSSEDFEAVKQQISFYKKYRKTLQYGEFYRIKCEENGVYQWLCVAPDRSRAIGLYLQKEVTPNFSFAKFKTKGLEDNRLYHFTNRQKNFNIKEFGDLINTIAPIHIKQDSLLHNLLAKLKKLPSEKEDCLAFGEVFNRCGVKLKQGFAGVGYDSHIRLFQDYASRIYLWELVDDTKDTLDNNDI